MGLLEKLRLKKPSAEKPALPAKQPAEKPAVPARKPAKTPTGRAFRILVKPLLSEKGTRLAGGGKYLFAVERRANKTEIRKSIESVYQVRVTSVRIINMPSKIRRYGRTAGRTASWKKAIITVAPGEKIPGIIESVG